MIDSRETRVSATKKPDIWDTGTAAILISFILLAGGLLYSCKPLLLLFSLVLAFGMYRKTEFLLEREPIVPKRISIK